MPTLLCVTSSVIAADRSSIAFDVRGPAGQPVPCRIHVKNERGETQRAPGLPFWNDHFVCRGSARLALPPGAYHWEIERGPEWQRHRGLAVIEPQEQAHVSVSMKRVANLRRLGWYSGDLHVHRSAADVPLLMMAEDLDYAPVIDWWNKPRGDVPPVANTEVRFGGHRIHSILAGEDEREGGALLYFGLHRPLDLKVRSREIPSPMEFVRRAREMDPEVWIEIEKPFWWDVPTWLASGQMNSIGIANNHMNRAGMLPTEAWGRPRDADRLPPPRGNGFWTQEIYYRMLNAGIRLPPSAGSASGVLKNPVGYNRVYVHLDGQPFTRDNWFAALSQSRCFVTNGPLLRVRANQRLPGTTIQLDESGSSTIDFEIELTSLDKISHVEVIHNGKVIKKIMCSGDRDQRLSDSITISRSGWLLVRAIADVPQTFRFASTAPWTIESSAGGRHIDAGAAQFFLDWVNERIERIKKNVSDQQDLQRVLQPHLRARAFWTDRVATAHEMSGQGKRRPLSRASSLDETRARWGSVVHQYCDAVESRHVLRDVDAAANHSSLFDALAPLVLLDVSVNPESRVKIAARRDRMTLAPNATERFLIACRNEAGTTAPLRIVAMDMSTDPPTPAPWCDVEVVDGPLCYKEFNGAKREIKVVAISVGTAGLREARLVADAGQGTQDLGFRATTDLIINVK